MYLSQMQSFVKRGRKCLSRHKGPFQRLLAVDTNHLYINIEILPFGETGVGIEQVLLCKYEKCHLGRSWWPCGLGRRSAADRLLESGVQIPMKAWVFVSSVCCVLCR
jgi:hypothetical protein